MLRWQAAILNRLYQTNLFDQIIMHTNSIEEINYHPSLHIYQSLPNAYFPALQVAPFIEAAHLICGSKLMQEKRDRIVYLDHIITTLAKEEQPPKLPFEFFHVIAFSCLSKCIIWPGMFKTSQKLVPFLIEFYSNFHNQFKEYLQYKFDPLILSPKFNRVVKAIKDKKLYNPQLFSAVQRNDLEGIKGICEADPQTINECIKDGLYLTHFAAIHANLPTFRLLLELGGNFELLDLEKQTPIFYAVKRFDLQIVKFFVEEAKVNINHTEFQNRTPIYLAAFEGKLDIVDYLYSKGADPEIQSKLARTPLSKACYLGNYEVAAYLIKLGVRIESTDSKGRTALHNAAWGIQGGREGKRRGHIRLEDSPECVELLIKAGHRVDFEDYDKFTPLFSAISSHAQRSLRLLVQYGANLKHKTIKNETSVFIASKYGHLKIIHMLINEYNCDFLQENNQGYSPLAATFTRDEPECSEYLLDLYCKKGIFELSIKKILQCMVEYKKVKNWTFLLKWLGSGQEQKKEYFAKIIGHELSPILEYVFQCDEEEIKHGFFKIIKQIFPHLSQQSLEVLSSSIEKHQFYTDETLSILLARIKQGLKISKLSLNHKISENTVLQLLSIQTNLTDTLQHLYQTFLTLINMRYTKAILYILRGQNKEILERSDGSVVKYYEESEVIKVLYSRINGRISVDQFCMVHGHYDIHNIVNAFYQEKCEENKEFVVLERPIIPKYDFQKVKIDEVKSYLFPVAQLKEKLNFQSFIAEYISHSDLALFHQISTNKDSFKVNPKLVRASSDLLDMQSVLKNKRLIGIDIQHYSSTSQSFICLIQISTFQEVFIIDRFNTIDKQLYSFLCELFRSQECMKIFHSYDNDLKWLVEDYSIPEFHNVYDTAKIYGLLQGNKNQTPSLKFLAKQYLGIEIRKEYQQSDWRIRPLFKEMVEYAGTDAQILPYIFMKLLEEATKQGKLGEKNGEGKRMVKSTQFRNMIIYP